MSSPTQEVQAPPAMPGRGTERRRPAPMKWWGWGHEGIAFSHDDKPGLRPFLEDALGIDVGRPTRAPAAFDALEIAAPELPASLRAALEAALGAEHVSTDALDRV
ncbi:MAG: alkyldihydroxyacetonephosphate synthase, partial [Baekduia sp.]|nr:alkyldihydroxyacetonephosphate synthase [Baekduia sp.]